MSVEAVYRRVQAYLPRQVRANWEWCILAAMALAASVPYLRATYAPDSDSLLFVTVFHHYYEHFVEFGELPRWLYHGTWGVPGHYYLITSFTPFSYAVGFAGALAGIRDTLLLAKLSVLAEYMFFAASTWLLSRILFSSRTARFYAFISMVLPAFWPIHLYWNFRFIYAFPLGLYFLYRFVNERRVCWLWFSGCVFALGQMGNVLYYSILWALPLAVFLCFMSWRDKAVLRALLRPRGADWISLASFLGLVFVLVICVHRMFDGIVYEVARRDAEDQSSNLYTFLFWFHRFQLDRFWGMFYGGNPYRDTAYTLYAGMTVPLFAIWGGCFARRKACLAALASAGAVLWLAAGGVFAVAVYAIPGFDRTRYIADTLGLFRFFIVIPAAFGVEHFTQNARMRHWVWSVLLVVFLADLMDVGSLVDKRTELVSLWTHPGLILEPGAFQNTYGYMIMATRTALYARLGLMVAATMWMRICRAQGSDFSGVLMVGFHLVDVMSYVLIMYAFTARMPDDVSATDVFRPEPIKYQESREEQPSPGWSEQAFRFAATPGNTYRHEFTYSFAHYDVVQPKLEPHMRFRTQGVDRLLTVLDDEQGVDLSGLVKEKIQFPSSVWLARSASEAEQALSGVLNAGGEGAVILDPSIASGHQTETHFGHATAVVTAFSANRCIMDVVVEGEPAYLIYTDAWHKGWRVKVDGKDSPVLEANLAFKAIRLVEGPHKAEFEFEPGWRGGVLYWLWPLLALIIGFGATGWGLRLVIVSMRR